MTLEIKRRQDLSIVFTRITTTTKIGREMRMGINNEQIERDMIIENLKQISYR